MSAPELEIRVFSDPCELRADRIEYGPPIVPSAYRGWDLDHRCRPILPPDPSTPYGVMCGDCGRVTNRYDADGRKCCLGEFPHFDRCAVCGEAMRTYQPGQTTHPNCTPGHARTQRIAAELGKLGLPCCTCRPLSERNCPHCQEFAERLKWSP